MSLNTVSLRGNSSNVVSKWDQSLASAIVMDSCPPPGGRVYTKKEVAEINFP